MSGTTIQVYERGVLIHEYTLCKNPEGRIGWWDAVDGVFYDQTENLAKLAYVEPNGTQYIDTGISALREQQEEMECQTHQ